MDKRSSHSPLRGSAGSGQRTSPKAATPGR